jgi:hypothetical protein
VTQHAMAPGPMQQGAPLNWFGAAPEPPFSSETTCGTMSQKYLRQMEDDELAGDYPAEKFDEGDITEVIRPAAIVPEVATRAILVELSLRDIHNGGVWSADPANWSRYDGPWRSQHDAGDAALLGSIQVAYGTPTKYEITLYRATITKQASEMGWTVVRLCDEALSYGGLDLATCPRASLNVPPKPFKF